MLHSGISVVLTTVLSLGGPVVASQTAIDSVPAPTPIVSEVPTEDTSTDDRGILLEEIPVIFDPIITEPKEPEPPKPTQPAPPPQAPPQKSDADLYDYDIASYQTKYSGAESLNRNYNMRLAANSINGIILQPQEKFSFNDIILKKSNNGRDYKEAGVFVNGELSTGIGGGICQISSTLYQAALYSGMEITQRRNHSLRVGYMPAGRDATVSWGSQDFQFKNPLPVPVRMTATMSNGLLKITFFAQDNPNIGKIDVKVTQANGVYTLKRYRENGTVDHVASSKYKD